MKSKSINTAIFFPAHMLSEPARIAAQSTKSRSIQLTAGGEMGGEFIRELGAISPGALSEVSRLLGKLSITHGLDGALLTIPREAEMMDAAREWVNLEATGKQQQKSEAVLLDAAAIYQARRQWAG